MIRPDEWENSLPDLLSSSYIYKQFGYKINRSASDQLDNGTPVSRSELQPGDLVMFKKSSVTIR